MAEQFKNLVSTTLNGGIDDSTTSVTVDDAMGFTGGDFRILIDSEIMKVTGVSSLTFTVERGAEGTSASSHSDEAAVYHILTAGAMDAHDQEDMAVYDSYASRPSAGVPGRIFVPTDGVFIERDNGASWEGFGPIWPMTPPVAADFPTWVNQDSSTITDNKGAVFLHGDYGDSTAELRCCMKTYPTPPFTVEMAFIPNAWPYNGAYFDMGLVVRDSVSEHIQAHGIVGSGSGLEYGGYNFSSATSTSGSISGFPSEARVSASELVWLKYEDDSTNRIIYGSVNGYTWTQLVSLLNTDYVTPNQIGIAVNGKLGYTSSSPYIDIDCGMTVLHWKES